MASGRIVINEMRCKGCELCIPACPPAVISLASHLNSKGYRPATLLDPDHLCTGCALCATVCPDAAITVYRNLPASRLHRHAMEVA
ncbi:MAG: 4Fe-4S dicluster domain-containing protein [Chloroflexi bacterium]|jgi:2-oxoglutarate ferredoxin oxidoreductase subunit delta|nr:4Fe-4S dicluster domain-containing protein [Chloroflexota bacterium]